MFPAAKFILVVVAGFWLLEESKIHVEVYGDVIPSTPQQISPPLSGYGAPPSPASPTPSGYSIYDAPPPPHKSKCPPTTGVQCCTPPAPYTYGYGYGPPIPYYGPPNPYYGPPNPYYGPPNPYTYVPYGQAQAHASMILPILLPFMMLLSSFV